MGRKVVAARGQGPPSSLELRMASAEFEDSLALRPYGHRLGLLLTEGPAEVHALGEGLCLPLTLGQWLGRNGGSGLGLLPAGPGLWGSDLLRHADEGHFFCSLFSKTGGSSAFRVGCDQQPRDHCRAQ